MRRLLWGLLGVALGLLPSVLANALVDPTPFS